jgi:hypothetical protein
MHTSTILDRLVAVNLAVRIWSGRKKLTAEDLSLGGAIPPEDLVSLGSKRVCDPEAVRVFQRLKHQAERVCLQGGMRLLGGFAIPEERAELVAVALDDIGEAFAQARATFVAGYGEAIATWIAQHPAWEAAIRRAVEPASQVELRLGFGYQLYRVAPVEQSGSLEQAVTGLGDTLFSEIAQMARTLDQSFIGKEALSRRALSTFRRIREKLGCLAFVDYRVEPVRASANAHPAAGQGTGDTQEPGPGAQAAPVDGAQRQALAAVLAAGADDGGRDLFTEVGTPLGAYGHGTSTIKLPLPEDYAGDPLLGIQLLARVQAESARLTARLLGLVQASRMDRPRAVRQGRRLMARKLHRVAVADARIFARKHPRAAPNSAVHLLVDLSDSMWRQVQRNDGTRVSRSTLALESALALALALAAIPGVAVAATAFPGLQGTAVRVTRLLRYDGSPRASAGGVRAVGTRRDTARAGALVCRRRTARTARGATAPGRADRWGAR